METLAGRTAYTGPRYEDAPEDIDVLALFDEKLKRHKWGEEIFNGSRAAPLWTNRCVQCGIQRRKFYTFGMRRQTYTMANGWKVEGKAPSCESAT